MPASLSGGTAGVKLGDEEWPRHYGGRNAGVCSLVGGRPDRQYPTPPTVAETSLMCYGVGKGPRQGSHLMIKLKCPKCRAKLKAEDEVMGDEAICPQCHHHFRVGVTPDAARALANDRKLEARKSVEKNKGQALRQLPDLRDEIPAPSTTKAPSPFRKWVAAHPLTSAGITGTIILVFFVSIAGIYFSGGGRFPSSARRPQETPKHHIPNLPTKIEYLEEKAVGAGYYAWIQIEPLARPELEKLGQRLLSRMRRFRCDHLKVWVCYTRRDYAVRSSAVWMNATSHDDYKIGLVGAIPESTTPQGFHEAYTKWDPMVSSKSGKGPTGCDYKPEDDLLIYHDHWAGAWSNPLHMPAVILQMGHAYLPPDISHPCWAAIPGLKRVVVHYYQQEDDPNPVVTLSFGRHAFENAKRLAKPLYKKESELDDMLYEALKRHHAKAMSDQEYRASCDQVSRQIYKLYEDLWVEVSPGVRIEVHRKMPPAPQDFYRKYFCGGK